MPQEEDKNIKIQEQSDVPNSQVTKKGISSEIRKVNFNTSISSDDDRASVFHNKVFIDFIFKQVGEVDLD